MGVRGHQAVGCDTFIGDIITKAAVERLAKIFKTLKEDEFCVDMVTGAYLDEDK